MQVRRLFHGVKGAPPGRYASFWGHTMTDEAKQRIKILSFWEKHGLQATLKKAHGDVEALNPRSLRPRTLRRRKWPPLLLAEIKRLRQDHPNLGKEKSFICSNPGACRRGSPALSPRPSAI